MKFTCSLTFPKKEFFISINSLSESEIFKEYIRVSGNSC